MEKILEKAESIENYIIDVRRDFHQHPELSGAEFKTQQKIMEELDKLGISYVKAGNASLIASIKGEKSGKVVALRGDMDALPIIEQSGLEFSSKVSGVMHGCGHDAHTAMLLGAAKLLSEMKSEINGEIRFFFQEAEETFKGAKEIIKAGGMEAVDACFGMHGLPTIKTGFVNIQEGYRLSGCDTIFVKFEGISGHGSTPHLAKDTIHPACVFVSNLQSIVTKNINAQEPIVLSVGKFTGGTKANIVAQFTELDISMRYFDPSARKIVHEAIKRHAKAIADGYEIKAEVVIEESTLSTYNDGELSAIASKAAAEVLGDDKNVAMPRQMASEDFSYFLKYAKGVYALVGFGNEEKGSVYPPHNEKFKIDEDYLKYGTALYSQFALDFLNKI